MTVLVRRAEVGDFEAVTGLLTVLGRTATPEDERGRAGFRAVYETQLGRDDVGHLVAEVDGVVAGFCSLWFRQRLNRVREEAWVPDLVVSPAARRRGAARALLTRAFEAAEERGCWQLTLESGHARKAAHALYRGAGMHEGGLYFTRALWTDTPARDVREVP